MINLGSWIKSIRLSNDIDSLTFSEMLGITPSKLSKIEAGHQTVEGELLIKVMENFNVTPSEQASSNVSQIHFKSDSNKAEGALTLLTEIMARMSEYRALPFKNNPLKAMLVDRLPEQIQSSFSLSPDDFKITGSIGKGQFAEIPWLCVFINDITKTATKGYYVVFLFSGDGQYCYLTLNQGWTFYQEKYGTRQARAKIQVAANQLTQELTGITDEWLTGPLDLNVRGNLAKGYELGNICAKKYELHDMPTVEQFASDFEHLLGLYNEINILRGNRSVDDFTETLLLEEDQEYMEDDDDFNESVSEIASEIEDEPVVPAEEEPDLARKPVILKNGKAKYTRRASVAAKALKIANFKCEIDETHETFISKVTNQNYVEGHHLIHISAQADFPYELDCTANIVALCPTCHRLIHHGTDEQKAAYLEVLHAKRADQLAEAKIYLPLVELNKMYGIK